MTRKNTLLASAALLATTTLAFAIPTEEFSSAAKPATTKSPDSTGDASSAGAPKPGEEIIKEGDVNRDGRIDVDDLMLIINNWGDYDFPTPIDIAPPGGNYHVGFEDLQVVLNNWGT